MGRGLPLLSRRVLELRAVGGENDVAIGAVDMAAVAVAADEHLVPATRVRAQVKPGLRPIGMAATAAPVRRRPMPWTRAAAAAMMPLQSCLCTVSGTAPKQNLPVMGRRRACLSISAGSTAPGSNPEAGPAPRIARVGPQVPPAPSASLRAGHLPCVDPAAHPGAGFAVLPSLGSGVELRLRRFSDTGGKRPRPLQCLVVAGLRFGNAAAQRLNPAIEGIDGDVQRGCPAPQAQPPGQCVRLIDPC